MELVYGLVAVIHTLGAVFGLGPALAGAVVLSHLRRNPEALPVLGPVLGRLARFPKHGGMLQLASGLVLVALRGWSMLAELWIWSSVVLVLVAAAISATQMEPIGRQFIGIIRSGQITREQVSSLSDRLAGLSQINMAILVVILVLMVFRP